MVRESVIRGGESPGGRLLSKAPRALGRLVAIVAAVGVGLFALYLVGMNVFLRTRLFRNAISYDPTSLQVEYGSAYSLWPGRIHVEGLAIRGRDSHVEWILRLDRCDFRPHFWELVHKRFHAGPVVGDGMSLRLRRRQRVVTPEEMKALPPVPGFADPPLADPGPQPPPLTDENYNLWSVRLDSVDAGHVREIWVDTVRYAGDMEIRGSWVFRPIRWLEIGPATVDARPVAVSYGMDEPWVSGGVGDLAVTVHPGDLRTLQGTNILARLSVEGELHGLVHAASLVNRATDALHFVRADAPVDLHVRIDRGVVRPGTELHSEAFVGLARTGDLSLEASLEVAASVDPSGKGRLRLAGAGFVAAQADSPRARVQTAEIALTSQELDLVHPFSDAAFAVDVQNASTDSLAYWCARAPIPRAVQVQMGTASGSASIEGLVAPKTAAGRVDIVARGIRVRLGAETLEGDIHAKLRAHRAGPLTDVSGSSVEFTGAHDAQISDWWSRVDVAHAAFDTTDGLRFHAEVAAEAKDASPIAAVVANGTAVPAWFVSAISTRDFTAAGEILVAPGAVEARSVTARGAGFDAGFAFLEKKSETQWVLLLDLGLVVAGVQSEQGKTGVVLFGARPWFAERTARLRASGIHD